MKMAFLCGSIRIGGRAAGHLHAITGSLSFKQEFPVSRAGKLSGNVPIAYSACWRPRVEAARDLGGAESLSD